MSLPHPTPLPLTRRVLLAGAVTGLAGIAGGCGQLTPAPRAEADGRLRLLGESRLPRGARFRGMPVGGLSGIDFDPAKGEYLLLSDDRSDFAPARFYSATWSPDAAGSPPELTGLTTLRQRNGAPWPARRQAVDGMPVPDPEAIRLRPDTGTVLWTSEGDIARGFGPALFEAHRDGMLLREFALPPMFQPDAAGRRGPRDNLGFEGLALTPDGRSAWLAMEGPLVEDGPVPTVDAAGGLCRFTQVDLTSGRAVRQIAYLADPIPVRPRLPGGFADNGVSEVLMLDAQRMLVLERAYAVGSGNSLRLYEIDVHDAGDVLATAGLAAGHHQPVRKRLIADFATLGLSRLDNTEGMCWGPSLPDGRRMLVVVSDDNFNLTQITQFAAFAFTE